jgi:hypothetical protein
VLRILAALACAAICSANEIRVIVYDSAGVAPVVLDRAGNETLRIFRQIGVEVSWVTCQTPGDPPCEIQREAPFLTLRIFSEQDRRKLPVGIDTFGFALSGDGSEPGYYFGVFYEAVREEALYARVDTGLLLGHVVAHEMGHLLLGGGGHSVAGLMKHPWRRKQLERIAQQSLLFSGFQARKIREEIGRRSQ